MLELEAREATGGPPKPTYLGDRELFPGQHGAGQQAALDGATWAKLQSLAGSPPVRLGRGERRPTSITDRPLPMFAKQAEAEVAAEVVVELESLTQSLTDPMQKLLALQLRQQQTLLTRLAPKPPGDALYHALGGGGNESGSSSGGIRGCAARELFVKHRTKDPLWRHEALDHVWSLLSLRLGNFLQPEGRGHDGVHQPWIALHRASCSRFRSHSDGLAFVRISGTELELDRAKQTEDDPPTICQAGSAVVGCSERCVCEGLGFSGRETEEQRQQDHKGRRARDGSSPKEEVEEKGGQARQNGCLRHCIEPCSRFPSTMSSTLEPDVVLEVLGETEGAFAVDSSQFGACEQPGTKVAEPSWESPFSRETYHPKVPKFSAASKETFSFLEILLACLHVNQHTHVGLRDFICKSLKPVAFDSGLTPSEHVPRNAQSRSRRSGDLMPCPPPMWRWTGPQKLSPMRRKRRKFLALKNSLVQQIICTLNWEALGHVSSPPRFARIGSGYSSEQWAMVERIDGLVSYFASAGDFEASSLGRSADKLERLLHACQELPEGIQDVDLLEVASVVRDNLDPYSKQTSSKISPDSDEHFAKSKDVKIHVDTMSAKPVVADRIKWNHSPSFDPRPFLTDPIVKTAFENPDSLRLPEALWVKRPQGKVHCSRQEVLKLAEKWDAKGACKLFPCSEVPPDEAVGIFSVTKDQDWDRLVLNPVVINGRMRHYSNYTKSLAPGCMIGLIQLGSEQVVRISADDLAEMYYTFQVPENRARRNCLRMRFSRSEIQHLSCFDPQRHNSECYVALSALAMGDNLAVEIAQQAHYQVLMQLGGSMKVSEQVCYRKPFPRGPFYEFLAIDDHLGLQVCSKDFYRNGHPSRDTEVFTQAEKAYQIVGLVQHPNKKKRQVTSGIFLGAEVDGLLGRVSSPRHRVGLLMLCTGRGPPPERFFRASLVLGLVYSCSVGPS